MPCAAYFRPGRTAVSRAHRRGPPAYAMHGITGGRDAARTDRRWPSDDAGQWASARPATFAAPYSSLTGNGPSGTSIRTRPFSTTTG
jgi:hypothetical protein